jgi:hypothetical protein
MNVEGQRRYRTFLLIPVYFIVVMMGIAYGASAYVISPERQYLYSLVLALVLTQVCIVDSKIVGKPLPIFSYWLVFIFYIVAVPISVVRARGLRGLICVAAHFVGMALALIISFFISSLLFGTF